MIRGVIFDLGSTLIRFEGDWLEARNLGVQAMVEQLRADGFNLDEPAFTGVFIHILEESYLARDEDCRERTAASLVRQVMSNSGCGTLSDKVLERALEKLYAAGELHWRPMPHLHTVLNALQADGVRLGIISNASDDGNVQRLIDNANIRSYFDPIFTSAATGIRKPDPQMFLRMLESWGLTAPEVVMVGDLLTADILGAQRAGVHQIWLHSNDVVSGRDKEDAGIEPEATADDLTDVLRLIRCMGA